MLVYATIAYVSGTITAPVSAQDKSSLLRGLEARAERLCNVVAEFSIDVVQIPRTSDPFDVSNVQAAKRMMHYDCRLALFGSEFVLSVTGEAEWEKALWFQWRGGKLTTRTRDASGRSSVIVDPHYWRVMPSNAVLTPYDLALFEAHASLLKMAIQGLLSVTTDQNGNVVAEGYPLTEGYPTGNGNRSDWHIKAVLDPRRGYYPVRLSATLEVEKETFGDEGAVHYEMRPSRSQTVNGVEFVADAIVAMRSRDVPLWQINAFKLKSVATDPVSAAALMDETLPSQNVAFLDRTTGVGRVTDSDGIVTFEQKRTPEQLAEDQAAIAKSLAGRRESAQELERRSVFLWTSVIATAIIALFAGVLVVRRRRAVAA